MWPAIKHPRLRFSLRAMLLAVTVLGLWLGFQTNRIRQRAKAVELIESLGGHVSYDYRRLHGYDSQPPGSPWMQWLFGKHYAAKVIEAELFAYTNGPKRSHPELFTDAEAKKIAVLTDLDWLVLFDTNVTDEGLRHFKALHRLSRLDLERTKVTTAGVMKLHEEMPLLRIVYGDGEMIGDYRRPWYLDENLRTPPPRKRSAR